MGRTRSLFRFLPVVGLWTSTSPQCWGTASRPTRAAFSSGPTTNRVSIARNPVSTLLSLLPLQVSWWLLLSGFPVVLLVCVCSVRHQPPLTHYAGLHSLDAVFSQVVVD